MTEPTGGVGPIRDATAADAGTLSLIGAASFLDAYAGFLDGDDIVAHCARVHTPAAYEALLADGASAWLASDRGAPIGYAVLADNTLAVEEPRPGDVELLRIYVLSRYQRSGVGSALLRHAMRRARARTSPRLLLGMHAENARAHAFYAAMGFREIGRRRFLVGGTLHDDLILGLDLTLER
jgi:ribosomal protein S18 acetylase RimI-like enzyme